MVCVAQAGLGNLCPVFSPPPLCLLELKQRPVVEAASVVPRAHDHVVLSIPSGAEDVPIPSPPLWKDKYPPVAQQQGWALNRPTKVSENSSSLVDPILCLEIGAFIPWW